MPLVVVLIILIILIINILIANTNKDLTIENLKETNTQLQKQVDTKNTFNSLTNQLFNQLHYFDNAPIKEKFNVENYKQIINGAYTDRADPKKIQDTYIPQMQAELKTVTDLKIQMSTELTKKPTTALDDTLNDIMKGFSKIYYYSPAAGYCINPLAEAEACVYSKTPQIVYINMNTKANTVSTYGETFANWYMKGVVIHETAHVLQDINPIATKVVLPTFNDNREFMADCLVATIYSTDFPKYAYGHLCDSNQQKVINKWLTTIMWKTPTIIQGKTHSLLRQIS